MTPNLTSHVTSLELSKRLKELGVPQNSLFWWLSDGGLYYRLDRSMLSIDQQIMMKKSSFGDTEEWYSAFLSSEIGEMLPECYITQRRLSGQWECLQDFVSTTESVGSKRFPENSVSIFADTEPEARGLMLEYLLKNGLLKLKE